MCKMGFRKEGFIRMMIISVLLSTEGFFCGLQFNTSVELKPVVYKSPGIQRDELVSALLSIT